MVDHDSTHIAYGRSVAGWMQHMISHDVMHEISRSWTGSRNFGDNLISGAGSLDFPDGYVLSGEEMSVLREQKTAYTVLAALPGPLGEPGAAELARLGRRERILEAELAVVAGALAEAGVAHLLLRGPAIGRRYPPGWKRQYNDLDVLLRREEQMTAALNALATRGYYLARPIVCRKQERRTWLGVALNKTVPGLGHPMYLDLATLGPGLGASRAFVLPDAAWAECEPLTGSAVGEVGEVGIPVLATDWQAVVFAVELVEREGRFVDRDLLDLHALDLARTRWPEVAGRLSGAPQALAALRRAAESFGLALDLRSPVVPRRSPLFAWRERVPAAFARAQRAGRKVSPGVTRALVRRFPTRLWHRLGLPLYLLPTTAGFRGYGAPGTVGPQTGGLRGFVAQVQPLVPPGYSAAVFKPALGAAA
jgi:hypothetical protein